MLKTRFLVAFFILFNVAAQAQKTETFIINPSKSLVMWAGKKIVGGNTEGTILVSKGSLDFASK